MSLTLQLGFPNVPKSITNPNVDRRDALDVSSPMSFLQFIKLIIVSFDPDTTQSYYNSYVKDWNSLNFSKESSEQSLIVEKYREFLQDIIIQYTTLEEKKFLSNADFTDPLDLDVILGFYSKKLIDICSFYNEKRTAIKFSNIKNKIVGSNYGSIKTIYDLSLSYLKTLEDSKMLIDFDEILSKFSVDIEELYDTYPTYFDQPPSETIYDNKDLDYGMNIFLKTDTDLLGSVFAGFSESLKEIKEADLLFENKRKLTQKYLYADYYYLQTGNTLTDIISGKLFEVDNSILNFLNRYNPTTASTPNPEYLRSHREQGFFKPSKVSIVVLDGVQKSFEFNYANLKKNSLYFFPDPNLIGKNGDVLIFNVDDYYLKKNQTSGDAVNQPSTSEYDTKYYGYASKIDLNDDKYLDTVSNIGYISDAKSDIYGNLYGLFTDGSEKGITHIPTYINTEGNTSTLQYSYTLDGHKFYDNLFNEGFGFNYDTEDYSTYTEVVRTGLTINGDGNAFTDTSTTTLFLGTFGSKSSSTSFVEYPQPIPPTSPELVTTYEILEGGFITKANNTQYPDTISSDLSTFEFSGDPFYYTDLIEGGIFDPTQRALLDPLYPSLTANFVDYDRTTLNYVDGEKFGVPFEDSRYYSTYSYDDTTNNVTTLEEQTTFQNTGVIMVRNNYTRTVAPLLESLNYLQYRFPQPMVLEMGSGINKFELINNVLIIETAHYLIMDKISYIDGEYVDPKTSLTYITHSQGDFDHVSNRMKVNNLVYYCKMHYLSGVDSNTFYVYPTIYKFDPISLKNTVIYTRTPENITDFFGVSGGDIRYVTASDIILTHNSKNEIFNVSFLLKDQNFVAKLYSIDYYLHPDPIIIDQKIYSFGGLSYTSVFNGSIPTNIEMYTSGTVSYQDTELIL